MGQLTKMSIVLCVQFWSCVPGADHQKESNCKQNLVHWAEPLFKDKRKFVAVADPLLEGKYPIKAPCIKLLLWLQCICKRRQE
ncbi:hypothetical protein ZIOFF_072128 [Zingiber officinale]|uniref:Uncharacterized protein n=1 Tax=Zingiber officinale TaxID=94328 RepID=A0A8J5C2Q6_ZINOF|nr:hypothetical protein ZIOFF_072128 [Zingiber officinale]